MRPDTLDSLKYIESVQEYYNSNLFLYDDRADLVNMLIKRKDFRVSGINDLEADLLFHRYSMEGISEHFSRYEVYYNKLLIWHYSRQVEAILTGFSYQIPDNLIFASIRDNNINSHIFETPFNHKAVTFRSGIFDLITNLCYIISHSLIRKEPHPDHPEMLVFKTNLEYNDLVNNEEVCNEYKKTFTSFLNKQKIERKYFYRIIDEARRPWFIDLLEYSCMFLLSHEYAHIVLGHTIDKYDEEITEDNSRLRFRVFQSGESSVTTIPNNWIKEYDADNLAFQVCLHWGNLRGLPIEMVYQHTEFLLNILNVVYHLENNSSSITHPDPMDRMINLRLFFKHNLNLDDSFFEFSDDFLKILIYLTEISFPGRVEKWSGVTY